MRKLILTVFAFLSLVCAPAISYAQDVKIGVLYPLTGPVAQVGKDAVAAVKTALDIINNSHNIPGMPLAKDAGLKGLGGGKYLSLSVTMVENLMWVLVKQKKC